MTTATELLEEAIALREARISTWRHGLEDARNAIERSERAITALDNEITTLKEALDALTIRAPQQ